MGKFKEYDKKNDKIGHQSTGVSRDLTKILYKDRIKQVTKKDSRYQPYPESKPEPSTKLRALRQKHDFEPLPNESLRSQVRRLQDTYLLDPPIVSSQQEDISHSTELDQQSDSQENNDQEILGKIQKWNLTMLKIRRSDFVSKRGSATINDMIRKESAQMVKTFDIFIKYHKEQFPIDMSSNILNLFKNVVTKYDNYQPATHAILKEFGFGSN